MVGQPPSMRQKKNDVRGTDDFITIQWVRPQ